jgi:probable phosphoglycerate mutase
MQFVFVRHGQPEWFRDGAALDNPSLTLVGAEQAVRTGARFQGDAADALLVSPLVRARETAAPIAAALGLEPVVCNWLAEIASPPWKGAPLEQVQAVFAAHRDKSPDEQFEGLDGGESFHDFHRRVTHGFQEHLDALGTCRVHDDPALWTLDPTPTTPSRVVIVAHGGTNASLIGYLLGIAPTPWEWERFVSFHASVSDVHPIEVNRRHAYSLRRFADVSHLPPGLQTV